VLRLKTCPTSNGSDVLLDFIVLLKLNRRHLAERRSGADVWQSQNRRVALWQVKPVHLLSTGTALGYLDCSRKNNFECCAPAGLARIIDGAVMGQDDLFYNRQAQAATMQLGGLK
jgi:hypothetical protein